MEIKVFVNELLVFFPELAGTAANYHAVSLPVYPAKHVCSVPNSSFQVQQYRQQIYAIQRRLASASNPKERAAAERDAKRVNEQYARLSKIISNPGSRHKAISGAINDLTITFVLSCFKRLDLISSYSIRNELELETESHFKIWGDIEGRAMISVNTSKRKSTSLRYFCNGLMFEAFVGANKGPNRFPMPSYHEEGSWKKQINSLTRQQAFEYIFEQLVDPLESAASMALFNELGKEFADGTG